MSDLTYQANFAQALEAEKTRQYVRAEIMCDVLYAQQKSDPNLLHLMARVAMRRQRPDDAVRHLERCVSMQPKVWQHKVALGRLLIQLGRWDQAIRRLKEAERSAPGNIAIIGAIAVAFERLGKHDECADLLADMVQDGKENADIAVVWAQLMLNRKEYPQAIAVLERHVSDEQKPYPPPFFYVLGEACDRAGQTEASFKAYARANAAQPPTPFSLDEHVALYRDLVKVIRRETIRRLPRPVHDTSEPIFIAGRPRSGTTLIEKILDAHPKVIGIGEFTFMTTLLDRIVLEIDSMQTYPACVKDLDQGDVNRLSQDYLQSARQRASSAGRTVDKNIGNPQHLGLIAILLPQSRTIHISRDPVDNCWACFVQHLNYGWSTDLRLLGITHRLYERLMRHWREELDIPILDVPYESLVDDPHLWTHRIIDHLGLPWNDACLRFHERVDTKPQGVSQPTISYNQVRQPIYKSSVKRSAKFEPFLGPLFEGLEEGARIAATL